MNATGDNTLVEKPLSGKARALLVMGVGATMLVFYVLAVFAILLLAALIGGEFIIFLALARFGATRLITPHLGKHIGILVLVLKSFRLQKATEFRIPLPYADAPGLHDGLGRLCQRLGLAFPEEIGLQMGDSAWVQLKGLRSGAGKVTLGVGYDLLAGMTVLEMESILAHEMTHAKLINRGFRNWLWAGQSRIRNLAILLWNDISAARQAKQSSRVAHGLLVPIDRLLRLSTRLTAAYSRQDEFEADRGAAELCGSAVMKSALAKLESLHQITSRLPWNERVAQLQQTQGYSQWLLREIAQGSPVQAADSNQVLFDKYSTHPLIRDRLAALPEDHVQPAADSPSGIQLLAHPDDIAVKLVTELQRLLAEQERKDSRELEKFSRKTNRHVNLRPWQSLGFLLVLGGTLCGLAGLASKELAILIVPGSLVAIVAGVIAYRLGKYRDRLILPVPDYAKLVHPAAEKQTNEEIQNRQKEIEAELTKRFAKERKSKRAMLLAKESYAALAAGDYLRAHVIARQCLNHDEKSVAGALALAIACASFGQIPDTVRLLAFVQKQAGFKTFSTAWGAGWAGLLAGDWIRAEAMLEKALKLQPQQRTLPALLAIAQAHRGKLQSSIANARRACEADPTSKEKIKYLIGRLLDGGYTREAQEWIQQVTADLETDPELMMSMAQLHLLQRNAEEAHQWTARFKQAGSSPNRLVRLGRLYETARLKEHSAKLYHEALATGHFPEAHLALGRLETEQNNKAEARQHILAALNVERTVGKEGVNAWEILHPILSQWLRLHEPIPNCRAWIAAIPGNAQPAAVAGQHFMVYAPDIAQAQDYFRTMMEAFQPGKSPLILPQSNWTPAPKPLQPDGPVRPGVQGIWN
jgi:uncharacterized protein HemY